MRLVREHRGFLLLFAAVLAARLAVLWLGPRHLNNDEALLSLMGADLLRDPAWRPYPYGQVHNGGGALEAYLAAASFALFGPAVKAAKAVPLLLSMAGLALLYGWAGRRWGRRAALFACALYAALPTLLPWTFQLRGYAAPQALFVAVLWCAHELESREDARLSAALGLCAGLLVWCTELSLPPLLAAAAVLFLRRPRALLPALPAFALGYAPALLFNLGSGMANWAFLWRSKLAGGATLAPGLDLLPRVLLFELPRFFGRETSYLYTPAVSAAGAAFLAFFAWALFDSARRREPDHALALASAAAAFAAYALVPWRSPGHLLWVCAPLAALGGRALARRAGAPAAAVLGALLLLGLGEAAAYARRDEVEGLAAAGRSVAVRRYAGESVARTLALLEERGIAAVWAAPSFQLPLVFESGGRVSASAAMPFFAPDHPVIPSLDAEVASRIAARPVFVLEADSPLRGPAERYLRARGLPWESAELGDLVVLWGLPGAGD